MTGKKNMIFGFFYFILTLALGMYLANKLGSGGPEWLSGQKRSILRAAHAHGNLEALLNVVMGYLLCRLKINAWLAQAASVLFLAAAVFHSGMLYSGGFGFSLAFALTPVGSVSMVLAMLAMGVGVLSLKRVD